MQMQHFVKEQCHSGNTKWDAQVAFVDDYPQKASEMLDRKVPKGINNVPEVGTSAMLATKQEPLKLVIPALAVA